MKGLLVIILLILSLALAVGQFSRKADTETDSGIDQTINSLGELRKILPPSAHISIRTANVPVEVSLWSRYALIPNYVSMENYEHFDTTLVISKGPADSLIAGKTVIWRYADSQYHYYLSCKRPQ